MEQSEQRAVIKYLHKKGLSPKVIHDDMVLGKVPTVSIDKTDGCQIYLSQESLDVEIVSSKSSEMNVLVPTASGDYSEYPIPEQFKTLLNKPPTGLTTTPVESKG